MKLIKLNINVSSIRLFDNLSMKETYYCESFLLFVEI